MVSQGDPTFAGDTKGRVCSCIWSLRKHDTTFFNGEQIGETQGWTPSGLFGAETLVKADGTSWQFVW